MTRSESGETVELLPCPFCGGKAERRDFLGLMVSHQTDCLLNFPVEQEAIYAAWNTRATLTPTMEAAPVERGQHEDLLRATVRSVSDDIALFAACCDVSGQHDPNWLGIKAKAEEWVADLRTALSSPPEGPDKEGV